MLQAAQKGDAAAVRALLQADPSLARVKGDYDKTPLHWAAEKNNREISELLLDAGADINAEVTWGMTPLQWAANMGSRKVADLLLARGARPQLNMWAAAGLGMLDVVQSFFKPDGTLVPNAGQTRSRDLGGGKWGKAPPAENYRDLVSDALHIAARNGHKDVVAFLLEKGADINARGFFGAPGLHWAAINGHRRMVEFLVEHGADLNLRDQQFNSTVYSWAKEGNHAGIMEYLRSKGLSG